MVNAHGNCSATKRKKVNRRRPAAAQRTTTVDHLGSFSFFLSPQPLLPLTSQPRTFLSGFLPLLYSVYSCASGPSRQQKSKKKKKKRGRMAAIHSVTPFIPLRSVSSFPPKKKKKKNVYSADLIQRNLTTRMNGRLSLVYDPPPSSSYLLCCFFFCVALSWPHH